MQLTKEELNKMQEVLKQFPEVEQFVIVKNGSSGIGDIVSIKFNYVVNDTYSTVEVEISGVEDW